MFTPRTQDPTPGQCERLKKGHDFCFYVVSALGVLAVALYKLVESLRKPDFIIKKLEKLESAGQLAVGIDISPALHQELVQVIPAIVSSRISLLTKLFVRDKLLIKNELGDCLCC